MAAIQETAVRLLYFQALLFFNPKDGQSLVDERLPSDKRVSETQDDQFEENLIPQKEDKVCQTCAADLLRKVSSLEDRVTRLEQSFVTPGRAPQKDALLAIGGDSTDSKVDFYRRNVWTPRRVMPRAKANFGSVLVTGNRSRQLVYACGGNPDQKQCWLYDVKSDAWSDRQVVSMQRARYRFDLVTPGDGYMYAVGGVSEDTIERYSFEQNSWTIVAQLPQIKDGAQMVANQKVAATSSGGAIFILGFGEQNGGKFWRYDTSNKSFTELPASPMTMSAYYLKPSLLTVSRDALGSQSDFIYVVSEQTDAVYRYAVADNVWETIPMKLPDREADRLRDRSAVIVRGPDQGEVSLYLVGGYEPNWDRSTRVDRLVLRKDLSQHASSWEKMADMLGTRGQYCQTVTVQI